MPNTPPAIGAALVSPAIVTACGPSTITVDVADPTGVASVAVNYSYAVDKASSASGTANLAGPTGGGTWSGSFTLPVNTGFGQTALSLTVTATDAQGLATQTSPQFFQAAAC
jgi:hypothetical protein